MDGRADEKAIDDSAGDGEVSGETGDGAHGKGEMNVEAPLARDEDGNCFDPTEKAAWWRVRQQTSGRPRSVLDRNGQQLYIPISAGASALEDAGCEPGRYRLEAVDENRELIPGVLVAIVDLAGTAIERASGHADLAPTFLEPARNHSEALTRTVEAMQRTQLEYARQLAERERWQMHAMVESQRSMALICTSLIERLKPAAPATANDPLAILKKQLEADELLDRIAERRNGTPTQQQPTKQVAEPDDEGGGGFGLKDAIGAFVGSIAGPLAPAANEYLRAQTYKLMGLQPEQIAAKMEAEAQPAAAVATPNSNADEVVWNYRRALRQVQGELSDEEVDTMDSFFSSVSDEQREALFSQADAIADLDVRVEWTRKTMSAPAQVGSTSTTSSVTLDVPPAFKPLFDKLTVVEQQTAARIVKKLDLATMKQIGLELLTLSPDAQLAKVREMIRAFEQREASSAQRAVFSVFKKDAA